MTTTKQANRAGKALMGARSDLWESQFYCKGSRRNWRHGTKKTARRAARRLARLEIREGTP